MSKNALLKAAVSKTVQAQRWAAAAKQDKTKEELERYSKLQLSDRVLRLQAEQPKVISECTLTGSWTGRGEGRKAEVERAAASNTDPLMAYEVYATICSYAPWKAVPNPDHLTRQELLEHFTKKELITFVLRLQEEAPHVVVEEAPDASGIAGRLFGGAAKKTVEAPAKAAETAAGPSSPSDQKQPVKPHVDRKKAAAEQFAAEQEAAAAKRAADKRAAKQPQPAQPEEPRATAPAEPLFPQRQAPREAGESLWKSTEVRTKISQLTAIDKRLTYLRAQRELQQLEEEARELEEEASAQIARAFRLIDAERFAKPAADGGAGVAGLEVESVGLTKLVVLRACLEQQEVRDLIGCAGVRVEREHFDVVHHLLDPNADGVVSLDEFCSFVTALHQHLRELADDRAKDEASRAKAHEAKAKAAKKNKQSAIERLRPRIEPLLKRQGMSWEEAQPMLEAAGSLYELEMVEAALDDPETFLSASEAEAHGFAGYGGAKQNALVSAVKAERKRELTEADDEGDRMGTKERPGREVMRRDSQIKLERHLNGKSGGDASSTTTSMRSDTAESANGDVNGAAAPPPAEPKTPPPQQAAASSASSASSSMAAHKAGPTLNFGLVAVGDTRTLALSVHNPAATPAEWSIRPPSEHADDWSKSFVCEPTQGTLQPDERVRVQVTFKPTADGAFAVTVPFQLPNNDCPFDLSVKGIGQYVVVETPAKPKAAEPTPEEKQQSVQKQLKRTQAEWKKAAAEQFAAEQEAAAAKRAAAKKAAKSGQPQQPEPKQTNPSSVHFQQQQQQQQWQQQQQQQKAQQAKTPTLDFGGVAVGSTRSMALSIHNPKQTPANWEVQRPTEDSADWGFFACEPTQGTLQPDERVRVQVTFKPTAERTYAVAVPFKLNGSDLFGVGLTLKGVGTDPLVA